jgi:hypothetical protein
MEVKIADKIRGDRLVLGLGSVVRTLIVDSHRRGLLDVDDFVFKVRQVAETHREMGDPNDLADALDAISNLIAESVSSTEG